MSQRFVSLHTGPEIPDLLVVQSTRHGGVSPPPYDHLNLGLHTDDQPTRVAENRRLFFRDLDVPEERVGYALQVHGTDYKVMDQPGFCVGMDALITDQRSLYLTVTVADCTPVLLYAPDVEVIAAIHAGWRGTTQGITDRVTQYLLSTYQAAPGLLRVWIGIGIGGADYEVDTAVADHFSATCKIPLPQNDKWLVDIAATNREQLLGLGVLPEHIYQDGRCTLRQQADFFSHRGAGGATGRGLAVIGMR